MEAKEVVICKYTIIGQKWGLVSPTFKIKGEASMVNSDNKVPDSNKKGMTM